MRGTWRCCPVLFGQTLLAAPLHLTQEHILGSPLGTHKCIGSEWLASGHGRRASRASLPSLYGQTIPGQGSLQVVLSAEPSVCLMGCGSLPDPPPVPQVTRDPAPQALLPGNLRLTPLDNAPSAPVLSSNPKSGGSAAFARLVLIMRWIWTTAHLFSFMEYSTEML